VKSHGGQASLEDRLGFGKRVGLVATSIRKKFEFDGNNPYLWAPCLQRVMLSGRTKSRFQIFHLVRFVQKAWGRSVW